MAIVEDKSRGKYYISYHIVYPNGDKKTVNIKRKEWSFSKVGKRYMKSIEASEIEKDKAKRLNAFSIGGRTVQFASLCSEYVREQERTLKRGTSYAKSHIVTKYILPSFRVEAPITAAMTPETCRRFKESVWEKDVTSEHKGRIIRIMREVVAFAADNDLITYEDARKMEKLLTSPRASIQEKPQHEFWTPEEYQAFRDTFKGDDEKWGVAFDVIYYGALRLGEALALKWKWVDFSKNSIFINEALDLTGAVTTTKNSASRASVSLPTAVMDELSWLKGALCASEEDYVIFGKKTSRTSLRRKMDAHIKEAGVKKIRVHDLRHSMASRLINMGVNPLIVSKHLRHSSTQQTLDTYSHLFPNITDGIMDQVMNMTAIARK